MSQQYHQIPVSVFTYTPVIQRIYSKYTTIYKQNDHVREEKQKSQQNVLVVFVVWKKQISSTHSHPCGRIEWTAAKNHRETIMFAFMLNTSAAAKRRFLANESLNIYFSFSFPLWITTTHHGHGMGAIGDQIVRMRTWTNILPFYYVWLSIVWSTLGGLYPFHINFANFFSSSSSSVVIVAPLFALSFVSVFSRFYFFLIECSCCCCCVLRTYINIDANNLGSECLSNMILPLWIPQSVSPVKRPFDIDRGIWKSVEIELRWYSRSRELPKYHHFVHFIAASVVSLLFDRCTLIASVQQNEHHLFLAEKNNENQRLQRKRNLLFVGCFFTA